RRHLLRCQPARVARGRGDERGRAPRHRVGDRLPQLPDGVHRHGVGIAACGDVGHGGDDGVVPAEHGGRVHLREPERLAHRRDGERAGQAAPQLRPPVQRGRDEQPLRLVRDDAREPRPHGVEAERAREGRAVAGVLAAVEREHARADDLRRREAGVVDGEGVRPAHHLQGEVPPRHEPGSERRQPGDGLVRAQPRQHRVRVAVELVGRRRRAERELALARRGGRAAGHGAMLRPRPEPEPPRPYNGFVATTAVERALLLDGRWVETGDWLEVRSPYDGALVGRVAKAGAGEARRAVEAAERAMAEPLPAHRRAEILVRVAGALGRRADEAARLISAEAGKPLKAARVEVARAISTFTMAAVAARTLAGQMVPMDASQAGEGKLAFTLRVPVGVVAAISPFNFPLNLVAHKIAPALAAGCAVVLKPASQTPLSALLLAELETEAGLPPGWLNVLVGPSAEIGDVLVEDERVKLIT